MGLREWSDKLVSNSPFLSNLVSNYAASLLAAGTLSAITLVAVAVRLWAPKAWLWLLSNVDFTVHVTWPRGGLLALTTAVAVGVGLAIAGSRSRDARRRQETGEKDAQLAEYAERDRLATQQQSVPVAASEINDLHRRILAQYAHHGLASPNARVVASAISVNVIRTERALDELAEYGLVEKRHNVMDGTIYRLSADGKDYLIRKGLV
jgi:DNA-binding MarR family transcriptional regulator